MLLRLLVLQCLLFLSVLAPAAVPVPEDLAPWRPWALQGHESVQCPFFNEDASQRVCAWPGRLELSADDSSARFAFEVSVYADAWVALPGDAEHWPQDVAIDGRAAAVVLREGLPQAKLAAGTHKVTGTLRWERRPESVRLGIAHALVSLVLDGQPRDAVIDAGGRLWFGRREVVADTAARNAVSVRVFRQLRDGVPLMLSTRIEINISGEDREILLGRALPEGFAPVALDGGGLPVRLDTSGDLRVQVRPGRWVLLMESRQTAASVSYKTEPRALSTDVAWPSPEIWVFSADHNLRTVRIEGAPTVDPRQSGLPEDWQALPAYALAEGSTLKLVEQVRGDANPQPEPLKLTREFWLDFNGEGFTARDRLQGTLERSGRLAFAPGVVPGRVTLNGEPQVITALTIAGEQGQPGIEVRPGPLDVEAVSRVSRDGDFIANGYARDVQELSATLHLPPGWTLFAANGVDSTASWLSGWTLWDIFLVLVLIVAAQRLFGVGIAALTAATLLVTHDVGGAPVMLWLNLVAVMAVWRVLPEGRVHSVVGAYRALSIGVLAIVLLLFAVDQVRQGIYPELEYGWRDIHAPVAPQSMPEAPAPDMVQFDGPADQQAMVAQEMMAETTEMRSLVKSAAKANVRAMLGSAAPMQSGEKLQKMAPVDPGARVQTGPGVAEWSWNLVPLHWDGPVAQTQTLDLWFVGPKTNRLLCFLRVLLCAALLFALVRGRGKDGGGENISWPRFRAPAEKSAAALLVVLLMLPALLMMPTVSQAAFPDAAMIEDLRNRLLAPPDCLPSCAAISRARIEAETDSVVLRLRIDAQERVGVPLPTAGNAWRPRSVLVDGRQAQIVLIGDRILVALEPGAHDVVLEGSVRGLDNLSLTFALAPGRVEPLLRGWQASGIVDGRLAGGSLELRRVAAVRQDRQAAAAETRLLNDPEPPFVIVERTLSFDIDWQLQTRVVRVAPSSSAFSLMIPLLPGENVTSRINLKDGAVVAALAQDQPEISWSSVLKPVPSLTLSAGKNNDFVERWFLAASTRWHVDAKGIPPQKGAGGTAWFPWPGESLVLNAVRPQAIIGDTLTIEAAKVHHEPGHRAATTVVSLKLLASEGGEYRFPLPEKAVLESISVDGNPQVIAGDGTVAVITYHPGEQHAEVRWRSDEDMGVLARTPPLAFARAITNFDVELAVPAERWALFAGGPGVGPAILFWGVLVVVLLVAYALGRIPSSPLRSYEWALLALGMSSTMLPFTLLVVAWFFVIVWRGRMDPDTQKARVFNFTQVFLALFTLIALGVLLTTIPQSLVLGTPDMQITGNGSDAGLLHWYVDRTEGALPQGWLVSLPMWAYRFAMLAWSLWLALALTRWLKWGWQNYSAGGLWRTETNLQSPPPDADADADAK